MTEIISNNFIFKVNNVLAFDGLNTPRTINLSYNKQTLSYEITFKIYDNDICNNAELQLYTKVNNNFQKRKTVKSYSIVKLKDAEDYNDYSTFKALFYDEIEANRTTDVKNIEFYFELLINPSGYVFDAKKNEKLILKLKQSTNSGVEEDAVLSKTNFNEFSQYGVGCSSVTFGKFRGLTLNTVEVVSNSEWISVDNITIEEITPILPPPAPRYAIKGSLCIDDNFNNEMRNGKITISGISTTTGNLITRTIVIYQNALKMNSNIVLSGETSDGISISNDVLTTDYTDKQVYFDFVVSKNIVGEFDSIETIYVLEDEDDMIQNFTYDYNEYDGKGSIHFDVPLYDSLDSDREAVIIIESTKDTSTTVYQNRIKVVQKHSIVNFDTSTWCDVLLNTKADNSFSNIIIKCGDDEIYNGVIVNNSYPINIKDIINNYVYVDFKFTDGRTVRSEQYKNFKVYIDGELVSDFYSLYNYDFEHKTQSLINLNKPIFNVIDKRQFIICSAFNSKFYNNTYLTMFMGCGDIYLQMTDFIYNDVGHWVMDYTSHFDDAEGSVLTQYIKVGGSGTTVPINEYKIACDGKYKYCLYYVNNIGGIDWVLGNNSSFETINTERASYKTNEYILNSENHYVKDYNINFEKQITIFTDILNGTSYGEMDKSLTSHKERLNRDEQSKLFENIFRSPLLWIQDLEKNELYACNLIDGGSQLKTISQNGGKLFNYKLTVKLSNNLYI